MALIVISTRSVHHHAPNENLLLRIGAILAVNVLVPGPLHRNGYPAVFLRQPALEDHPKAVAVLRCAQPPVMLSSYCSSNTKKQPSRGSSGLGMVAVAT